MTSNDTTRNSVALGILSLAAAAGVPIMFLLMRMRVFTFTDDFTGFNAVGFAFSWILVLLLSGTVLGGLAWRANRRSWLTRIAFGINGLLLAGLIWILITAGWFG